MSRVYESHWRELVSSSLHKSSLPNRNVGLDYFFASFFMVCWYLDSKPVSENAGF